MKKLPQILGIVNCTPDSFSDGGKYFDPKKAIEHAIALHKAGAHFIDLGAESTHPDSRKISAQEEIEQLTPIVTELVQQKIPVSIDTYKPEVMKHCLDLGASMINDVTGLANPQSYEVLSGSDIPIVVMYSRSTEAHAKREQGEYKVIVKEITQFFVNKIEACEKNGISQDRLILDPGMGFFLGKNPEPSLMVLKNLSEFQALGCKLLISTTRKSFIGSITGKDVQNRGAGTLATELWAAMQGVDYIRTHDVDQLQDGLTMIHAINNIRI